MIVLTLCNIDRCECVTCLGTLTQNPRTRQRHMERYGCSERSNQDGVESTQNSRIAAPSSPTPSTPTSNDEFSPDNPSQSEHLDPDFDPIAEQQINPSVTDSDSQKGNLSDEDSSHDERPFMDDVLETMTNESDNESNTDRDEDSIFPGFVAFLKY